MKFAVLVLAFVGLAVGSSLRHAGKDVRLSPAVTELCDIYWQWRITDLPEFATFVGIHDYDDRLDDMSLAAYQNRYDQCAAFLLQAEALELGLTDHNDLLTIRTLKAELLTFIDGFKHLGYLLPLNFMEGIQVDLERLISWMVLNTTSDYEKLLSRYAALPTQLRQITTLLKEGVSFNVVNHNISMFGVSRDLGAFVVAQPVDSPLYQYFVDLPASFTPEDVDSLQARAKKVILEDVTPAFSLLQQYVDKEYVTRPDIAILSLTNGRSMYEQLLIFHTSTNLTADQIQQIGYKEVTRIEGEMAKIVRDLGYNLTVQEFSSMIREDPQFFYDNPEDLLAGYRNICYNIIEPKVPQIFTALPSAKLVIKADNSPGGAGAFYLTGAYDGSRPGVFYVSTSNYNGSPKYEMITLSLHEGNPGHHLQGSYAIENPSFPFFRRTMEDRNYGMAPSRFPINTAYTEGWGLYSESLGFDLELFNDPYDRYGHYSDEIFRACRLVVDTGMHALGWTRQEAIDYMYAHTAMTIVDVQDEIDRYITWPGQALAYKIGQLKITELRQKSTVQLGAAFDIKAFHDIVLDSVGPLQVLEDEVDNWLASFNI